MHDETLACVTPSNVLNCICQRDLRLGHFAIVAFDTYVKD